jgi:hypothetical protein
LCVNRKRGLLLVKLLPAAGGHGVGIEGLSLPNSGKCRPGCCSANGDLGEPAIEQRVRLLAEAVRAST